MNKIKQLGIGLIMLATAQSSIFAASKSLKSIYGYLEPIIILPTNQAVTAKLDTGAYSSSISAIDMKIYENEKDEGKKYVKFKFSHPTLKQEQSYDLPVVRTASIKNRAEAAGEEYTERPVVMIKTCFNSEIYELEANLIDRTSFSTPVLLGRKGLVQLGAVVDPSKKDTISACSQAQLDKAKTNEK